MKIPLPLLAVIILSAVSLPILAVEEIVVIGTPTSFAYSYSTADWYMNSMMTGNADHFANVAAGRSMYEAIQKQLQACATAKDRIQKEYSDCMHVEHAGHRAL